MSEHLRIIDGSSIDVTSDVWMESVKNYGVTVVGADRMVVIETHNGDEYAFKPVNEAQRILIEEIAKDLVDLGATTRVLS